MGTIEEFEILPGKKFYYKRTGLKVVYKYHSMKDFANLMRLADYLQMPGLQNYILALVATIQHNRVPGDWCWSWFYVRNFVYRLGYEDMLSKWICDWVVFHNTPESSEGDEWMDTVSTDVLKAVMKAYARREAFLGHARTCP